MKKRHPCRFKVEPWPFSRKNAWQSTLQSHLEDLWGTCIQQHPKLLVLKEAGDLNVTTPGARGRSITSQVRLREQQLVLVQLVLLRLVVQGHQQRLELQLLEQRPVLLLHNHRLHSQCWCRMLNRSCCRMKIRRLERLRSKLELVRSKRGLVRSRLALACSTLRGLACTSGLCTLLACTWQACSSFG